MIDDELAKQWLRNIRLTGAVDIEDAKEIPVLGKNLIHILNLSSGTARLQSNVIPRFNLILSTPKALEALSPFEIRCALCRKVISYPCWYYSVKYSVNHFHYFVCFDKESANKPTAKCYKKGV